MSRFSLLRYPFTLIFFAFVNAAQAQSFYAVLRDTVTKSKIDTVFARLIRADGSTYQTHLSRYGSSFIDNNKESGTYSVEVIVKGYRGVSIQQVQMDSRISVWVDMEKDSSNQGFKQVFLSDLTPFVFDKYTATTPPTKFKHSQHCRAFPNSNFEGKTTPGTASLKCNVMDENFEGLPFAVIKLLRKDITLDSTETDVDGQGFLCNIKGGIYDVFVSYVGYNSLLVKDFVITNDKHLNCEFILESLPSGVFSDSIVVEKYKPSVLFSGSITGGTTLSAEDIASMATRTVDGIANATSRVTDADKGEAVRGEIRSDSKDTPPITGSPKGGRMTAGESRDSRDWKEWMDLVGTNTELKNASKKWGFSLNSDNGYALELSDKKGKPLANAEVELMDAKGKVQYTAYTDNQGKVLLWGNAAQQTDYSLKVNYNGKEQAVLSCKSLKNGINTLKTNWKQLPLNKVDICFAIDATGSMGDEMNYLSEELQGILESLQQGDAKLDVHLGMVYYRDIGDDYLTRQSTMNADIANNLAFIKKQSAGGGGDFPEAVHWGLQQAIHDQPWRKDALTRILLLVLDAPPHDKDAAEMRRLTSDAAAKGIKIVPIVASGINKDTEFLMRHIALATNGSYVFITDDSGLGDTHLQASKKEFKVEFLNGVILRLIREWSVMEMP